MTIKLCVCFFFFNIIVHGNRNGIRKILNIYLTNEPIGGKLYRKRITGAVYRVLCVSFLYFCQGVIVISHVVGSWLLFSRINKLLQPSVGYTLFTPKGCTRVYCLFLNLCSVSVLIPNEMNHAVSEPIYYRCICYCTILLYMHLLLLIITLTSFCRIEMYIGR